MAASRRRMSRKKRVLVPILSVLIALLLIIAAYAAYVFIAYYRLDDNLELEPERQYSMVAAPVSAMRTGTTYTVVTQNIGFGAYTPDFTFFMDGGKKSWAASEQSVRDCVIAAAQTLDDYSPDFLLIQEVDFDSTRSYHVDEAAMLRENFPAHTSVFAQNFDSPFLFYPFLQPHGISRSGIMTLSTFTITSAVRRQLPISKSLSKIVDLDRCFTVSRIPVENGKELILINVHMSAYGGSDAIRTAQMNTLFNVMKTEFDAGNYVICGGDFNHDFTGTSVPTLNNGEKSDMGWAQPFPADLIPNGLHRATDYTCGEQKPTCRNCDVPYVEGNFTIIVDGFIVSDNVDVTYLENVQTGFAYSDHSPVVMKFTLQK